MTEPTPTLVDREVARITAQMDQADAAQAQQDAWLARRYRALIAAGMVPEAAAELVGEYQGYLWGTALGWGMEGDE